MVTVHGCHGNSYNVLLGSVCSLLYLTLSSPHSILVVVACMPSARHVNVADAPICTCLLLPLIARGGLVLG